MNARVSKLYVVGFLKTVRLKADRTNFGHRILILSFQETFLVIFEIKNYVDTEKCERGHCCESEIEAELLGFHLCESCLKLNEDCLN